MFAFYSKIFVNKLQVECMVIDGSDSYDLSPLVKATGHYKVTSELTNSDDATYYINICRPLNPIQEVLCPPNAAACKVSKDGKVQVGLSVL